MKILNKKIITLFMCFFVVSCGNQPHSPHKKDISNDIRNPKQQSSLHFECHPSEYKFNTLPPIPSVPENAIGVILADEQINNAPFNRSHRLTIPMNTGLIISKLQDLGFQEVSQESFDGKNLYSTTVIDGSIYSIYLIFKDFVKPDCNYEIRLKYSNGKVNGVEVPLGYNGWIFKDTTIPKLIISAINHKNKPDNLFKDLLDKHIQNIETFKQKQPLNEELISTRAIYDGIIYEINSFGGGRVTMLQIYRYKDRKKSH